MRPSNLAVCAAPAPEDSAEAVIVELTTADPLASISTSDWIVTIAGVEYVVGYRSAAHWLRILLEKIPLYDTIIPRMLDDEDQQEIEDMLWEGDVTPKELEECSQALVEAASGRNWWFTYRLVAMIGASWDRFSGWLTLSGVDAEKIPLAAWLDACWSLALDHMDKDAAAKVLGQLQAPPEGVIVKIDTDDNDDAFFAAVEAARPAPR